MDRLTAPRFSEAPFTLAWEITRACALQCRHCRATAQRRRDARELTTEEGFRLIDQVADMGTVVLVVTGGDPLMRPDVYELIGYGAARGLRVAFSPSATGLANADALRRAREAGVHMVHVSLDGATAATHDGFRRVHGSYGRTMRMLDDLRELGVPLQVGTTVSRSSWRELPAIAALVAAAGARVWSVFFLVPTGRALAEDMVSPRQHEVAYRWLARLSGRVSYRVRTTAAPAYRRVVMQRARRRAGDVVERRPRSV
ncbi:MAG: radical SAM protein, partial [Chloroflexi bacterium]|nr:radical SAM protein [Chloroflexota bacterium]